MINKFYSVRYPPIRRYDIDTVLENSNADQKQIDDAFVHKLSVITMGCRGRRDKIFSFLEYHFEFASVNKREFLDHTEEIFKPRESELLPFSYAIGHVYDWINFKRKQIDTAKSEKIEIQKPEIKIKAKPDPSFEEIVRDSAQMGKIIQTLKNKGIVEEDLKWNGVTRRGKKTELVALIEILEENQIIKSEPRVLLGRLFSRKFQCEMAPSNFSHGVKDQTKERIMKEIQGVLIAAKKTNN